MVFQPSRDETHAYRRAEDVPRDERPLSRGRQDTGSGRDILALPRRETPQRGDRQGRQCLQRLHGYRHRRLSPSGEIRIPVLQGHSDTQRGARHQRRILGDGERDDLRLGDQRRISRLAFAQPAPDTLPHQRHSTPMLRRRARARGLRDGSTVRLSV